MSDSVKALGWWCPECGEIGTNPSVAAHWPKNKLPGKLCDGAPVQPLVLASEQRAADFEEIATMADGEAAAARQSREFYTADRMNLLARVLRELGRRGR